jgi:hypothetical protein
VKNVRWMVSERETVVELPWLRIFVCISRKLRTVLPLVIVGIRDSAVQFVLTHRRVRTCSGERVHTCSGACVWVVQQEYGGAWVGALTELGLALTWSTSMVVTASVLHSRRRPVVSGARSGTPHAVEGKSTPLEVEGESTP